MTDMELAIELAWLAGFADGEGCFMVNAHGSGGRLSIAQNDPRPLYRAIRAMRCGKVCGPYAGAGNSKPRYEVNFCGQSFYLAVVDLWPYLSEPKREQIERTMTRVQRTRSLFTSNRCNLTA